MEIPAIYDAAMRTAMTVNNKVPSTLKVKEVLEQLPVSDRDFISAQFYLREFRAQNKRVPKLTVFLEALKDIANDSDTPVLIATAITEAINNYQGIETENESTDSESME